MGQISVAGPASSIERSSPDSVPRPSVLSTRSVSDLEEENEALMVDNSRKDGQIKDLRYPQNSTLFL